jgi:tRNA(Ile2) C34 agmatinyltransferase TiaS
MDKVENNVGKDEFKLKKRCRFCGKELELQADGSYKCKKCGYIKPAQ